MKGIISFTKLKKSKVFYLMIMGFFYINNAQAVVRVDSVRYCRSGIPIVCNAKTQSEYSAWESNGVPTRHQKRTYIARYNTPSVTNTKHLLFIADGQANDPDWDLNGDSDPSWLTGRVDDFRDDVDRFTSSRTFNETPNSLPVRLLNGEIGTFNRTNTFAAAAWDARFHYGSSSDTLNRVANANFSWLNRKFIRNNLDSIVLVGHSRGGALVTVLAKKFRDAYPEIPVLVYTLEGVPSRDRSVPPLSSTRLMNPIMEQTPYPFDPPSTQQSIGFGYSFDFNGFYESTDQLRAVNVLTGRSFLWNDVNTVRPMAQNNRDSSGEQVRFFDWGWLQQEWRNASHASFNNDWAADYVISDIQSNIQPLLVERDELRPPVARCKSDKTYAVGEGEVVEFSDNGSPNNANGQLYYSWEFYSPGGYLGASRNGPGPHRYGAFIPGTTRAQLTVENSRGVTAKANCTFTLLGGCADPNAILCDAPITGFE